MGVFKGSRYAGETVYLDGENGITYLDPITIPKFDAERDDLVVIMKEGMRIDLLAYQLYGDAQLEWVIMDANPDIATPFEVLPGMRINIPNPRRVIGDA